MGDYKCVWKIQIQFLVICTQPKRLDQAHDARLHYEEKQYQWSSCLNNTDTPTGHNTKQEKKLSVEALKKWNNDLILFFVCF